MAKDTSIPKIDVETLRCEIRNEYAEVARNPERGFHFHTGRPLARLLGYADDWVDALPAGAVKSFAGTGNPFTLGELVLGERVVDVGCGAGFDSLIAAQLVGPTGHVIGVDMTAEMLKKAQDAAAEAGLSHAEVREGYVIPALGKITLTRLQPSHIQAFYREALESGRINGKGGLSPRSVQHIHRILSEALSHAEKWGLVGRNVARAVDPPRVNNRKIRTLDAEEVFALLKASEGTVYHPLLHLEVHTGLRRSELLALRWRDVDLDMLSISVSQVLYKRRGVSIFKEPKTSGSSRRVSMTPKLGLYLRQYKAQREVLYLERGRVLSLDDLVFASDKGKPLDPCTLTHNFARIVKRAGLEHVRFHDLRHSFASIIVYGL